MDIGVAMHDGQAIAVDLSSGRLIGKVGDKNARAGSSNGWLIAVTGNGSGSTKPRIDRGLLP